MAVSTGGAWPSARRLRRPSVEQRSFRRDGFRRRKNSWMARSRIFLRFRRCARFLLGSIFFPCRCHKKIAVVAYPLYSHACLRLFLQHGFSQLLHLFRPRLFRSRCVLERRKGELAYRPDSLAANSCRASHRVSLARSSSCLRYSLALDSRVLAFDSSGSGDSRLLRVARFSRQQSAIQRRFPPGSFLLDERLRPVDDLWPSLSHPCPYGPGLGNGLLSSCVCP